MNLTINASSNARSALSMQVLYARRLLQEAAVALPPAPSPNHPVAAANQRSAANSSSSPSAPSEGISTSPFNVSSQFSPTMVIILVILLSAFFFMGFFAIYVRRCTSDETFTQRGNPRGGTRRHDVPNSGPQRGLGVDASLVESFPMVSYAAAKRKGCNECVVCLADFERGEELKQLPKCKHVFHPGCIGMWLESHTTCPLCRRSLVNSDRWSMSWRWGTGSSRGGSTSARLFDGDSSHLRVGGGDQSGASPSAGSAGSSRGRPTEAEGGETASSGIPGSPLMLPGSAPAVLAHSRSMEIVPGCASCIGSEVAAHRGQVTNTATSRLASEVGAGSRAVWQGGWRRLGRSNSTGHSLRKDVMSRAAAAAGGCVPLRQVSLQRSRSMGLGEEEEEEEEETAAGVMAERSTRRVSGGGCSSSSGAGPAGLGQ